MIEQMKVIYLDTETTGLTNAEICQLSYITDNGIEVYGTNYFFKVFNMNPHARRCTDIRLKCWTSCPAARLLTSI